MTWRRCGQRSASSSHTSIDCWLLMGHGVRWDGKAWTGFDAANSGDTQSRHCS